MKVAFLFENEYPNYDLTLRVIQRIPIDDREGMNTVFSTGFWGIHECAESLNLQRADKIEALAARLILNQEGSLTRVVSDESVAELARGDIFAVIIHSINRSLALRLHEILKEIGQYRAMIQVLPHSAIHQRVFGDCPPILKLEQRSLFVWSSEDPDQSDGDEESQMADEIVQWVKDRYPLLGLSVQKKAVGFKGSIFDRDSDDTFAVHQSVQEMVEEWTEIAEHVIYKLNDFAPDVVQELNSALKSLNAPKLSAAQCGQVTVSLRRSLELLAHILASRNPERLAEIMSRPGPQREKYKDLIWGYLNDHFADNQHVGKDIEFELKSLDVLLNKGVHEHWITSMIRPLAIRTILVMNSLLFPVKAGVVQWRAGDDLFD